MKNSQNITYGVSSWYPTLADYTFPTTFVRLKDSELKLLAEGITEGSEVDNIVSRIAKAQKHFLYNTFVFADTVAATDTERFENKKGAVFSAESAWKNLTQSEKVRTAAKNGDFSCLSIRPFRNMSNHREFRLFINNGKLALMSQYWQSRHYHRLELRKDLYWNKAEELVDEISWLLPSDNIVLDIYFTSSDHIILLDFNCWGNPTLPLLAESWDIDWNSVSGIRTIPNVDESY